jgi:hypothetical protein
MCASPQTVAGYSVIMQVMPIADLLTGRFGAAGRLPGRIDDLRGPAKGVVMLPMHLSWPGMRECDVSDDRTRRSMYGMLLSQGQRNDIVRFVNPALLAQDWPVIAASLDPKLRRWCERQFALGAAPEQEPGPAPERAEPALPPPAVEGGPARAAR